jgi:methyl-accepting chemotaxis protein
MIISALKNWNNRTAALLPSWRDRLHGANHILHELAASTEGEFIQLGEKLQEFYFRTKGLSELSSQVAKYLSGEELKQDMDGLQSLFAQVQEQDDLSGKGVSVLSSLLSRFEDISAQLGRFDQTIRNLHVLCNFIKIESARLGSRDTGFNMLGDEVRKLAGNITVKSAELMKHSENLADVIRQGLRRMADFEKKQQGHSRLILDQAVQSLSAMTQRHQSSSETLGDIATRWKRISQSIGEVVASMQFHDITRQRLEHVCDALRDVGEKLGHADSAKAGDNPSKPWRIFRIHTENRSEAISGLSEAIIPCQVQSVQLKDADADMLSAVGRIMENLNRIASEITVMAAEMQMLASAGSQKEESFLSDLEKKLSSLADAIASYGEINREWSASMELVTASARDMTVFIREIDKIGIQMRMIALNASIHAAHLGLEGAALGILAESISRLSSETSQKIDEISDSLRAVMKEASSFAFHQIAQSDQIIPADQIHIAGRTGRIQQIDMSAQIEGMIAPLHQMDRNVSDLLTRIGHDGNVLTQDIETTIQGITVHEKISGEIRKVTFELESMVEKMSALRPALVSDSENKEMANMTDRYTMEREREIHESIAGSATTVLSAAAILEMNSPDKTPATATEEPEFFDDFLFEAQEADVLFADTQETVSAEIKAQEIFPESETQKIFSEPEAQETLPDIEAGEDLGDNVELF